MQLVFASSNTNKIREISALLPPEINLSGLRDIGLTEEIPETGITIKENAFLKADYVKKILEKKNLTEAVFADDSGLEVEALGGAPGVYSARFAGIPKDDVANNIKLMKALETAVNRKARFVTVICLILEGATHYFEGSVNGTISFEARGNSGFGYDPLFIPQGYRSTFSELGPEIKNSISHRAMAVKQLINFLHNPFLIKR
jgi:XTP/dITP diphosphohydrolase